MVLTMHGGAGAVRTLNLAAEGDFRLGTLLVRPSACRVVDARGEIRVEPRIMEVLIVLCRAEGGTVTRDQLIDACWSGRVISDDAIARVIAKVRQLANRGDELPHFQLETLPKIGYRLSRMPSSSGAIQGAASAEVPASDQHAETAAIPWMQGSRWLTRLSKSWPVLLVGAAVIGAIGLVWIAQWSPKPRSHDADADAVRLTQAARALIHERNRTSVAEAEHLLREAVAADPSYAPAWARLAHATWFPWRLAEMNEPGAKIRVKAEALAYANRALAIAPNLAEAQGIMGMIQSDTREGTPWLERAVRQDASSPELWMWLGDSRRDNNDLKGAMRAYEKARSLDPAWHYSDEPYLRLVFRLRGPMEAYHELDRIAGGMNDQNWALQMRADLQYDEGRMADAARSALDALRAHPQNTYWARSRLMFVAATLGHKALLDRMLTGEAALPAGYVAFMRANLNAIRKPGWAYARAQNSAETWWDGLLMGAQAAQLVSEGKSAVLVSLYDRRFKTPRGFLSRCPCDPIEVGPALVVALHRAGRGMEAAGILAGISKGADQLTAAGDQRLTTEVSQARIAALAGKSRTATHLVRDAVLRGWKGQAWGVGIDPARDPAFENLGNEAEFQAIAKLFHQSRRAEAEQLSHVDLSGI